MSADLNAEHPNVANLRQAAQACKQGGGHHRSIPISAMTSPPRLPVPGERWRCQLFSRGERGAGVGKGPVEPGCEGLEVGALDRGAAPDTKAGRR